MNLPHGFLTFGGSLPPAPRLAGPWMCNFFLNQHFARWGGEAHIAENSMTER
jgi:hypothetical protein